jgi:insulysin
LLENLDTLQEWVVSMFSDIKNTNAVIPKFEPSPIPKESLGKICRIVPVKDLLCLNVQWQCPSVQPFFDVKPQSVLSHLLGHEGPGSVLSALKNKGWAGKLSAGLSETTTAFSLFSISMDITESGLDHIFDILEIIYQYIAAMKSATPEKWKSIYQEVADVGNMNFRFKGKETPFHYCSSLSKDLHYYGSEQVLTGPWLYQRFDLDIITKFLNLLTPDNARVEVVSKVFSGATDRVETWYKTEFREEEIPREQIERLSSVLPSNDVKLPEKNNFIATDFTLKADLLDEKTSFPYAPELIVSEEGLKVWHKLDSTYKKPKSNVLIIFTSPFFSSTPQNSVLSHMFRKLVQDNLNEFAYEAEIAGLAYSIDITSSGMHLFVKGYNQKLHILMKCLVDCIVNFQCSKERFNLIKEQVRSFSHFHLANTVH